ncbi:MAG: zinc ABC transporter substrate-binding protein [Vampirovibrionales bacterium]|nr:zinc ABC transporter substrate-binding protein [Vampirovibrionales bacterium]
MKRLTPLLLLLLLAGGLIIGVSYLRAPRQTSLSTATPRALTVTASIQPMAALLREIGGERIAVEALLRPGDSPHTHEPSPQAVARVAQSAALFYVSPALDGWAARLPARQRIALLPLLPPSARLDDDPHFWMDPLAAAAMAHPLAQTLSRLDPAGTAAYHANAQQFGSRMQALHRELSQTLAATRGRGVVLYHPGLRYLLRRYDIRCLGILERSPGMEPSPRDLAQLRDALSRQTPRALLASPELSEQAAQATADALDARVVWVDELGATPERQTLTALLRYNARALAGAFGP